METLKNYISSNGKDGHKEYWWIYAIYQGKLLIDGWYRSEAEAYSFGTTKLPVGFEVVCLSTKDRQKATQAVKHRMLDRTGDIEFAIRRARHKIKKEV